MNWHRLESQVSKFGAGVNNALLELDILESCKKLKVDHVCVRLKRKGNVRDLKKEISGHGEVISSVNISGREISIIQLKEPLNLGFWKTHGVELPYPKRNHKYNDGWEHIEFVFDGIKNTMDDVFEAFVELFEDFDLSILSNQYKYSENEPETDSDQLPNPTIGLKVGGIGLKFHAKSIQEVVGFVD